MTKTDSDKADLYIGYQSAVEQGTQWDAWGTRTFGSGIGTLVLDMYDPGSEVDMAADSLPMAVNRFRKGILSMEGFRMN